MNHIHSQKDDNYHALDILIEMRNAKLPSYFVNSIMEHCQKYEGIRDLMEMWFEETNKEERDNIAYRMLMRQYFDIMFLRECQCLLNTHWLPEINSGDFLDGIDHVPSLEWSF